MKILLAIIGIIFAAILGAVLYRLITVFRQNKELNKKRFLRVEPLYNKLENGETITNEDIQLYAEKVLTRDLAYNLLRDHNKTNLFPLEYYTIEKGAESKLAVWLEFPTELDSCPDEMQYVKKSIIDFDGNNVIYHVFKFRVNEPHWAAKNGWMLGVVGPYFDDSNPYDRADATFSRLNKVDEVSADDEAKWVHENLSTK